MDEVFRVCQRATVMRDGKVVGVGVDLGKTAPDEVVAMMVGRELMAEEHRSHATAAVSLEVRDLSSHRIRGVSFDLHKGEVLGVAGLVGSGRTELLRALSGADRVTAGTVKVDGALLVLSNPRAAIAAGIGLLPEERKREGIIPGRSVTSNMALPSMKRFSSGGIINHGKLKRTAGDLLKHVNLRPFQLDRQIRLFSGGNQQKAIIARWLAAGSRILLFDEPTRGIDVGAKSEIYHLIEDLAAEGHSVIVVSSELPEVMRVSDRVLVMRDGAIVAELGRDGLSEETIVSHAVGTADSRVDAA